MTHTPWGILFLQETFRRTEGLAPEAGTNSDSDGGHLIYTTSMLHGGLRCLATVVNNQWCKRCSFVESSTRWMAVKFSPVLLSVSLHLPHSRLEMAEFTELFARWKSKKVTLVWMQTRDWPESMMVIVLDQACLTAHRTLARGC